MLASNGSMNNNEDTYHSKYFFPWTIWNYKFTMVSENNHYITRSKQLLYFRPEN